MPAPKKVELPPRKARKPQGVCWGTLLTGILVGIGATLLVQNVDYQQWLGQDDAPPSSSKVKDKKPSLLDSLPIDFYKILPNREEQVPEHLISQQIRQDSPQQPMDQPGRYRLQAGSFQNMADADQRRASILLLGLETQIQTVNHGGATWHRVMLGPFPSLKHLEVARYRLKENKIETIVIKLKNKR